MKIHNLTNIALAILIAVSPKVSTAETSLNQVLSLAMENNADLKSSEAGFMASRSRVSSSYTPDDPMIGISRLERGMDTTYFTVTQRFRFPTKYYVQGKSMKQMSLAKRAAHDFNILAVRQNVVEAYFNLYRIQKTIDFTISNLQSVKEVARVAEKKYSAGSGVQADSMRSHVEITRLEIDLLNYRQEEQAAVEKIIELVNSQSLTKSNLANLKVVQPKINNEKLNLLKEAVGSDNFEQSSEVKMKKHELEAAEWNSSLAKWEFAPDIQLQYQQAIAGMPEDSRIYGIGITVPLFFWSKSSKAKAASKEKISKRYDLIAAKRKTKSNLVDMLGRVETTAKTIRIYDTSLIPQAESTYNSSLSSYRANNLRLIDLLDSERSLYQVRLGYLKTLQLFARNLAELEKVSGVIVSDL